ncbi:MAG: hypothetical protein A3D26_03470 [Candidatus Blackburnbacteria bacterium RIFCSPHIGHO2_02_FULL_44_20]|uniref:Uncharacterized protein n=1 Tax=Candidatus Blackburnbacteria bacterium RIFCSPHIGHO2_02_FULL_44_20 TaxID=1797516 RepID=A0A1G1V4Q8_9BACT|nr:MAG: hypothetical protein A3D26_03470 [Candidatus Blackburnbacteria bacterium RIFCSPHIGHO2_02_FULL_44_20]OGY11969.1 MAG: hypothetical protein A3E16_02070 [Candidatus Blackburnbacteria bacterium RIFCSPHIGHO2_12_FULL_44_25]OGY14819.1 MAG: hypothetical protein A3A62_03460 [Candidatus Blackburnbacteria bacterium RIFCSPLOWO2_01_FULL_44_43]
MNLACRSLVNHKMGTNKNQVYRRKARGNYQMLMVYHRLATGRHRMVCRMTQGLGSNKYLALGNNSPSPELDMNTQATDHFLPVWGSYTLDNRVSDTGSSGTHNCYPPEEKDMYRPWFPASGKYMLSQGLGSSTESSTQ